MVCYTLFQESTPQFAAAVAEWYRYQTVACFVTGKSTVEKWFAKFKRGEMNKEDDARSGHPKEAVTETNIKKVHKIIFDNRKVNFIEITEILKISKERVGHIVNEYLDMRKLCSKWVPRENTIDQK
ncbi:putative mariner transposase [Trichonephila clavipes]|nr:putative mariner transposase [Trichonephila clavipes]